MSVLVALALAHTLMSSMVVVVVMMAELVAQVVVVVLQCGGTIQTLCGGQGTVIKVTLTTE